jgi:hypothetical protein
MSASTYELIGQIISAPRPAEQASARMQATTADEPLSVLIGRMLGPPAPGRREAARLAA